jgi:leader peptidase (prepilin peptidase)/N-methyltransferase
MAAQTGFFAVVAFLFGICVGSFLNVVVYRLPRGKSLTEPAQSFCPNCNVTLQAIDLIPLLSFLALGGKCRRCKQPISWRYFTVELVTGLLWVAMYLRYPHDAANSISLMLFTSVLVPVYLIDFDTFTIPDSLNILAFVIAVGRDIYGIVQHEPLHAPLWGWLPRSIVGAVVGTLIFGFVRVAGWLWKRREAMGLGDPLLARAMGAMLVSLVPLGANPLRLMPIWVLFSTLSGAVIGIVLIRVRSAGQPEALESEEPEAQPQGDGSTLGRELADIGYCLVLGDAVAYLRDVVTRGLRKEAGPVAQEVPLYDGPMAPTAIPFGPFLVIGFLATVFIGDWVTASYLAYALPKRASTP